jgi:hypothetical protein
MGVKLLPDKEAIKMETIYHHPDGGGSTHLWNIMLLQQDYTALYPRRLPSYLLNIGKWKKKHSLENVSGKRKDFKKHSMI